MRAPLLFVTPTMPALAGHGLAMRAGVMLEALAADHEVHLLVVPVVAGTHADAATAAVRRWCARAVVHPVPPAGDALFGLIARVRDRAARLEARLAYPRPALARFATADAVRAAAAAIAGPRFQAVHVFRLYLAPFAEPYLAAPARQHPRCVLDLDDVESRTRRGLAALHARVGDPAAARLGAAEAEKYAAMERAWLPRFDRVLVCSAPDRRRLAREHPAARVHVVPNAVRAPAAPLPPPAATPGGRRPFTLLFVGSLGYFPNADAALLLGREVLPRLRARVARPVRLALVGGDPPAAVRALAAIEGVTVAGWQPDLTGWYRRADAVVAPLRAGGGTRIKVLEAFAHGRPVVSTAVGAEGLAVRDGTHLLIGDGPDGLAARCQALADAPALGRALAARARAFVLRHHGLARVRARLRAVLRHA
jgi:glycosyltransferase involved in cell wall biosynthesis